MEKCFKIEAEIKRNPDLRLEDLWTIKDWVEKQPHLPHISGKN